MYSCIVGPVHRRVHRGSRSRAVNSLGGGAINGRARGGTAVDCCCRRGGSAVCPVRSDGVRVVNTH